MFYLIDLLKNDGVTKLFSKIDSPVLSIARRVVEVLHYICYSKKTWELIYNAGKL